MSSQMNPFDTAPSITQQRHQPSALRRRIIAVLIVGVILLCLVGGIVWRIFFLYNEYKLGQGIVTNNSATSQSALHVISVMRGIGLILFGVLGIIMAALDYFREPENIRHWTVRDTFEVGVSIVFIGIGIFLFYNDQFALIGLE